MTHRFLDVCDSLILNVPTNKQQQQQQQQQQHQQQQHQQQPHQQQPPHQQLLHQQLPHQQLPTHQQPPHQQLPHQQVLHQQQPQQQLKQHPQPHRPVPQQFLQQRHEPPPLPQRRQSQPVGTTHLDNTFGGRNVSGLASAPWPGINNYRPEGANRTWSVTGVKAYNDAPPRGQGQRSYSQGVSEPAVPARNGTSKLVNQGGVHNHNRLQRQRSLKNSSDDSIKWSRPHQSSYQLSQDLHDKQVEMLERKYGGSIRSRRAARTIQRAFRQYCMNKNFQKLRHSYGERRLSKRLSELGRSNTVWSDRLSTDLTATADNSGANRIRANEEDNYFGRSIRSMVADFENASRCSDYSSKMKYDTVTSAADIPRPVTERLLYMQTPDPQAGMVLAQGKRSHPTHLSHNSFSSPDFYADGCYGRSNRSKSTSVSSQGSNTSGGDAYYGADSINKEQFESSSSSGGGDFMRTPAVENTAVDPHSMDFEALLESKETDILTDSFHSESSSNQDITHVGGHHGLTNRPSTSFPASKIVEYASDLSRISSSPVGSFDSFRTISIDPNDYISDNSDSAEMISKSSTMNQNSATYAKEDSAPTHMKYYMVNPQFRHSNRDVCAPQSPRNVAIVPPTRAAGFSPTRNRKESDHCDDQQVSNGGLCGKKGEPKRMSNISETSEADSTEGISSSPHSSGNVSSENVTVLCSDNPLSYQRKLRMNITNESHNISKTNDKVRKRLYRIGLNLFNKKPEKGLDFLLNNHFLDGSPKSVARFFITRKGMSKQMIGEFLGNLQNPFSQEVLQAFCEEIDLSGTTVDVALRKFQCHFRMPGEAQKIERLMEAFADRYCECNPDVVKDFKNMDTVFLLAFAIIMLNTDLHNPSVKAERKMKLEEFIKNMRGIDDGEDLDPELLTGIYERIKSLEFKAGVDQVTQVMRVEQTIIGKKPTLSLPHRRLVCYCRLYEVHDPNKKEKIGLHQREVFLFNDLLLITKIFSKKKTGITYSFRSSLSLCGMQVYLFETSHYQFGIQLTNNIDGKPLITFNARNDHDRQKFVEDLKEAILETNGMEQIRIEEEMARHRTTHNTMDKRYACDDSRMLVYDLAKASETPHNRLSAPECNLKKVPFSNSLTDLSSDPVMKRGSSGASLDSGVASSSVGSTTSDIQQTCAFGQSSAAPLQSHSTPPQSHKTPPLGQVNVKRQAMLKTPIILKPGLPDGTQV